MSEIELTPASTSSSLLAAACLAVALPTLLAFNLPPSPTFFNQAAAFMGWGVWGVVLTSLGAARVHNGVREPGYAALLAALAVLAAFAAAAPLWAALPWSLALSSLGTLAATALVVMLGASLARRGLGVPAFHAFCGALLFAGILGALLAMIQVFVPQWSDGQWIAAASDSGRAAGNLRQPNHLSSLLLWSLVALVWVTERDRIGRVAAAGLGLLMLAGIVLTASRTGTIGVLLLAAWGWRDRALARRSRAGLLLAPLAYVALWGAFTAFKHLAGESFSGESQLVRGDFSSSRFAIWADTLALIARRPWAGAGWGEFNFAWTLTPFPDRPTAFFDHTHNLPLQLAAELGVPLAVLVLALLGWSLWRAFAAARGTGGAWRLTLRAAFMMVVLMALHSQLEYPLWYAYFLLPTAFAWGLCLGGETAPDGNRTPAATGIARPLWIGSALLVAGGAAALYDYMRVVAIFSPATNAAPLADRIAAGQRSVLFAHHADYAAMTGEASTPAQVLAAARRATHYLLDSRLMEAWAKALHASGDAARARYVAARLREFRNEGNDAFFEPCDDASEAPAVRATAEPAAASASAADTHAQEDATLPFQCLLPPNGLGYRDFR